jgi:hypothetical protein
MNSKVEESGKISGKGNTFEKRRKMSSAGGDRDEEGSRDADHLIYQFLVVV